MRFLVRWLGLVIRSGRLCGEVLLKHFAWQAKTMAGISRGFDYSWALRRCLLCCIINSLGIQLTRLR